MNVNLNIPAVLSYNYSIKRCNTSRNSLTNDETASVDAGGSLTMHIYGDTKDEEALTCVGWPDGSNASVYRVDSSSSESLEYKVKYWGKDGEEKEYIVNPKDVDPEDASYIEMLAYTTYADVNGITQNGFTDFVIAAGGVNQDITYDAEEIDLKYDFKNLVKEMMQLQYKTNNLESYLAYKKLFDYMDETK